jgi:hypothetical protein
VEVRVLSWAPPEKFSVDFFLFLALALTLDPGEGIAPWGEPGRDRSLRGEARGTNLSGADFGGGEVRQNAFFYATLNWANLSQANFSLANLAVRR